MRRLTRLACCTLALLYPPRADAGFTSKDGQVLGRTLSYVGEGKAGVAVVGIVFSAASPASRGEADKVQAAIGDGLVTGRVRLQARLVPLEQITTVNGVDALYVTTGLADSVPILSAAQRLRVVTFSTDMAYVERGSCVVGIASEPTVQIVISRSAAERAGVRFMQAFRMLVTEQ